MMEARTDPHHYFVVSSDEERSTLPFLEHKEEHDMHMERHNNPTMRLVRSGLLR